MILEGDREHSSGAQVPVDLSELREYSLFPGQVRGVRARSLPRGMCGGPGLQERAFHRWPAALGFRPLVPRAVAGAQAREWTLV